MTDEKADDKKPTLDVVAPVFPVADIRRSLAYYVDRLMFTVGFEWADGEGEPVRYAIVNSGDCELHLTQTDKKRPAIAYFFVSGIDAYYGAVSERGAEITEEIHDLPWEMREFELVDPDGHRLIFGQHLTRLEGAGEA